MWSQCFHGPSCLHVGLRACWRCYCRRQAILHFIERDVYQLMNSQRWLVLCLPCSLCIVVRARPHKRNEPSIGESRSVDGSWVIHRHSYSPSTFICPPRKRSGIISWLCVNRHALHCFPCHGSLVTTALAAGSGIKIFRCQKRLRLRCPTSQATTGATAKHPVSATRSQIGITMGIAWRRHLFILIHLMKKMRLEVTAGRGWVVGSNIGHVFTWFGEAHRMLGVDETRITVAKISL